MGKLDLDAIRRKIETLNTVRNARIQFWKPGLGEHLIRIIPYSDTPPDDPFKHLEFYYNILEQGGILCPKQFGKEDSVAELSQKLWSGDAAMKEQAKKLRPSARHYATIIDRADEEKGPQLFSFGKTIYLRLLGFFAKSGIGDYIDVDEGFDLEVKIYKEGKKEFNTTEVDVARQSSPLSTDPKMVEEWLKGTLNPIDAYNEKTPEEIEKHLSDWLNGGVEEKEVGMEKGEVKTEKLDDAIKSLQPDKEEEESTPPKKARSRKSKKDTVEEIVNSTTESIDTIFDDVLNKSSEQKADSKE